MVITGVCGTLNSGSIPGSRPPESTKRTSIEVLFVLWLPLEVIEDL
jgi:hypothetical protein